MTGQTDTQHDESGGGQKLSRAKRLVDGELLRMYSDGSNSWPSVSTVLDSRPTPEKDKSLQGWKNWLKGQPDRPDPDEVLRYKSSRGTLAHYYALSPLTSDNMMSDEEIDAYESLAGWEFKHDDALRTAQEEVDWFLTEFQEMCETWGIADWDGRGSDAEVVDNRVRAVEQYVVNRDVGYAGQFDLAYINHDGDTILADLKTSTGKSKSDLMGKKWPRYGLQLAAYAEAVEFDVDDVQVIWLSPDKEESAVIPSAEWPEPYDHYREKFAGVAEEVNQSTFSDY